MKFGRLGSLTIAAIAGSVAISFAVSRQPAPTTPPTSTTTPTVAVPESNLSRVLEVFRSDLNAGKVRMLNQIMHLTPEEAAKFWPIYQRYEKELDALTSRRIDLIKQFVALSNSDGLTNDNAAKLSEEWLQGEQDRLDLWKKYQKEIAVALSPIRAAQFLQVEHQISLLVGINIASGMPMVAGPK